MSDKGAFITGADFLVDGGATASYFYGRSNRRRKADIAFCVRFARKRILFVIFTLKIVLDLL